MARVGVPGNFTVWRRSLTRRMLLAGPVRTERWQGVAANQDTRELRFVSVVVDLGGIEDLDHWRADVRPNLPWADDHFLERVGGEPLNPGVQWRNWPWAGSAAAFKTDRFNHTYMERLWPKYARRTDDGRLPGKPHRKRVRRYPEGDPRPRYGIGYYYGDLDDLVNLLVDEPNTRQAWIPLFFPEDTGVGDGGRKPCTLGYQFLLRGGRLHMYYPLRSCDLVRHLRDDWYLAVRLLIWVVEQCRARSTNGHWDTVVPGEFHFHATSLHVFETDLERLREESLG